MKQVILITVDALCKDTLGCYGGGNLSPFIDSIQKHTIRFTNAQSTAPYTQASFPGILTSSYYFEYGKQKMLSAKRTLISEVLKNNEIFTAAIHSNAYLSDYFGWNRGWDYFYDSMDTEVTDMYPYIRAEELNRKIDSWLNSFKKSKPLFLWIHYMDMHEPYIPQKKHLESVDASLDITPEEMYALFNEVLLKKDVLDNNKVELLKKLYLAQTKEIDEGIKNLFYILKKYGLFEDTVIIFTSDHGEEFGEHGGLSHDGKIFNELINVPLFIWTPSLKQTSIVDTLVSTIDIASTITSLFGVKPADNWVGQSLLPLEKYMERGVFGECAYKHGSRETGNEKEIYYYREGNLKIIYIETDDTWQLYDLGKDPQEKKNVINIHPRTEEMREKLKPRIKRYVTS